MKRAMEYDQLEIRIHELEKVMKKYCLSYERYQAIMLHLRGYTNIKITEIIGRSNFTIERFCFKVQKVYVRLQNTVIV
ncbi:terminase gpP N-terminus-related DNA-binding protein [Bacillus cereus]